MKNKTVYGCGPQIIDGIGTICTRKPDHEGEHRVIIQMNDGKTFIAIPWSQSIRECSYHKDVNEIGKCD